MSVLYQESSGLGLVAGTHLLVQGGGGGQTGLLAGHQGGATVTVPPDVLGGRGQAVGGLGDGVSRGGGGADGLWLRRFLIMEKTREEMN